MVSEVSDVKAEDALNYSIDIPVDTSDTHKSTLNARKHPTRTIDPENLKNLFKRSEMESDEEKDVSDASIVENSQRDRRPTRTRKLSFAPEKIIDYKPKSQD